MKLKFLHLLTVFLIAFVLCSCEYKDIKQEEKEREKDSKGCQFVMFLPIPMGTGQIMMPIYDCG